MELNNIYVFNSITYFYYDVNRNYYYKKNIEKLDDSEIIELDKKIINIMNDKYLNYC